MITRPYFSTTTAPRLTAVDRRLAREICDGLDRAMAAGRRLLAAHGAGCRCSLCHDARGVLYNAELAREGISSELPPEGFDPARRTMPAGRRRLP